MSYPSVPAAMPQQRLGSRYVSERRKSAGRWLILLATLGLAAMVIFQALGAAGVIEGGFENWRPTLYAYLAWAVALGVGQVMIRGEQGQKALFVLPPTMA